MARGSFISLQQAIEMTTDYRNFRDTMLAPDLVGKSVVPTCETFDKELVQTVLDQDGCTGLRIYFSMDQEQRIKVILVGVDVDDNDILPSEIDLVDNGSVLEDGMRCPDICPPLSSLNG